VSLKSIIRKYLLTAIFLFFVLVSLVFHFKLGETISSNFKMFFGEMISFIPLMFILIGLFDVWFPKEKVEKHIGKELGVKGIFWVIILAMLQAGPLYGAFPVAYLLYKKGCSIRNIFIYLGAFSTLKIPMLTFEIGFLGLKFSLLRSGLSLPIFILIGILMDQYLKSKSFEIKNLKQA